MNDKLIECNCGHALVKGNASIFFGKGTSIECKKCGNKHVFKEDQTLGNTTSDQDTKEGISFKC